MLFSGYVVCQNCAECKHGGLAYVYSERVHMRRGWQLVMCDIARMYLARVADIVGVSDGNGW